ncbi:MAG: TerC family protein [Polyangiaceae bacterium]|nr:TerC family protein [Polyangiaceae bacterium]
MDVRTVGSWELWVGFGAFIALMLTLDLGVFHRRPHAVSLKEASIWSAVWVSLALLFNLLVYLKWGADTAQAFLTGYLIEKALSVDNLFVFFAIFSAFRIAPEYQHRLLFWGILGALVLRGAMIWGGTALLARFQWVVYVFGSFLVVTGVKMLIRKEERPHPEDSRLLGALRRVIPTTREVRGPRFVMKEAGKWMATPLLVVLVFVELTDIVFAVDSILAIFAVSRDPFIVYTSNVFAILGLRSLYFVLASVAQRFVYLQPGLALVLVFVGVKLGIAHWVEIPVALSLLVVATLLTGSIGLSILRERRLRRRSPGSQPA